jgi:hypothetical protein
MKEISIKVDDELYRRASQRTPDLEADVNQRVTEYLESVNGDEETIVAVRSRMSELFAQTKNFSVGVKPTREEMHQR